MPEDMSSDTTVDSSSSSSSLLVSESVSWYKKKKAVYAFWVVAGLVSLGLFAGMVHTEPVAIEFPGTAQDTEPFLQVSGAQSYPSEGQVLITTVASRQNPNFWEYQYTKRFRDDAIILELPEESTEEVVERDQQRMQSSQNVALYVALEKLGVDVVEVTGVQLFLSDNPEEENQQPSPAAKAGIVSRDIVESVDGVAIDSDAQLRDILSEQVPGDTIMLEIRRWDESKADFSTLVEIVEATLEADPEDPDRAILGVFPVNMYDLVEDIPIDVTIDANGIGGPSGGLAFTLAILDILTEGDLFAGKTFAVTGVIGIDGTIGPVGGVPQKAVAVKNLGQEEFIIPANTPQEDIDAAKELVGDDLELIPVASLDEALGVIEQLGGNTATLKNFDGIVE